MRIDHRSFKDQGIELEPGIKIGTAARDGVQVVAQRRAEQAEIQRRNGEAIIAFPDIAINPISKERAAFTRGNVRAYLKSHTVDATQLEAAMDAVMHSPDLVQVGKDSRGYVHYTTSDMLATEQRMLNAADLMAARLGHWVNPKYRGQALAGLPQGPLSADQVRAFDHLMSDSNLAVVQGYAGTGKSYMLAAARDAWQAQGYRVIGGALAGKAAEGLQISSGIPSRTLASWELMWQHGHAALTSRNVLVIDEAGMVGTRQLARVLERADEAGAKVVLVGDTRQLAAIEAGAPMRAIAERIGMVELTDIRRQKGWQAQATKDFGDGLTDKALDAYKQHGRIHEHETQDEALCAMVEAWDARRKVAPKETLVILAHRNVDVDELNARARAKLRAAGELGEDHRIASARGPLDLAPCDRVMFLKNDRQLGVLNGTLGTVEEIAGRELLVRLDDGREVAFDTQDYGDLRHGYAATVHKEQGVTVDRAYVLAGRTFDKQLVYVGMSRHRGSVELHWSREAFGTEQELREALGREGGKVNVTDLAPKTVNQLSQLAELEDRETWLSARFHPSMAAAFGRNLTAEEFALRDTRDAREHKEQEAYATHKIDIPAIAKAPTSTAISPEQRLADSLAIHAGTAETWQNWRDAVPADQQLDARLGRGEGSKPCRTFRETRAWAQEAGRDVEAIERGKRIWGDRTFDELDKHYTIAQNALTGRLDAIPAEYRTPEKLTQARTFVDMFRPYYDHAKQEHDAALAKQAQQKQHKPEVVRVEERGIQSQAPVRENAPVSHAGPSIPPRPTPEDVKQPPAPIRQHEARPPIQPQHDAAVVHRGADVARLVAATQERLAQERAQEQQREQAEAVRVERQRQQRDELVQKWANQVQQAQQKLHEHEPPPAQPQREREVIKQQREQEKPLAVEQQAAKWLARAKQPEMAPEPKLPEKQLEPANPFAGHSFLYLEAQARGAEELIKAGPLDVQKALYKQYDYVQLVEVSKSHIREHDWWKEQVEKFEREHPVKAGLHAGIPKAHDRYTGYEVSIYEGEKLSAQRSEQAERTGRIC